MRKIALHFNKKLIMKTKSRLSRCGLNKRHSVEEAQKIAEKVCLFYKTTFEQAAKRSRKQEVIRARRAIMLILSELKFTFYTICRVFNSEKEFHHATVWHHRNKMFDLMDVSRQERREVFSLVIELADSGIVFSKELVNISDHGMLIFGYDVDKDLVDLYREKIKIDRINYGLVG